LLAHPVAEGAVDALMAGDPVRSLELRGDDGGEEMAAVAFDLEVLAGEVGGDEALDVARGGVGHRPMLTRRPPQSAPGRSQADCAPPRGAANAVSVGTNILRARRRAGRAPRAAA